MLNNALRRYGCRRCREKEVWFSCWSHGLLGFLSTNRSCSGDEDQAQERVEKLGKALKGESLGPMLHSAGVGVVSCVIQRDEGRSPTRHSFHWSIERQHFVEEPLLRHVEPPLSRLLELVNAKESFAGEEYFETRVGGHRSGPVYCMIRTYHAASYVLTKVADSVRRKN